MFQQSRLNLDHDPEKVGIKRTSDSGQSQDRVAHGQWLRDSDAHTIVPILFLTFMTVSATI
jgi:hypothetical protein